MVYVGNGGQGSNCMKNRNDPLKTEGVRNEASGREEKSLMRRLNVFVMPIVHE
jgi:hypothetical protein